MATYQKRESADGKSVRWTATVFIGRGADGKRKTVARTFGRKKDAEAWARKQESVKDAGGTLTVVSRESLAAYLATWLDAKAGTIGTRTAYDYRIMLNRYVIRPAEGAPAIAAVRMDRLRPASFEALYTWMREAGLSVRTIQYTHTILRMALEDAKKKGLLPGNPTDYVTRPTRPLDGQPVQKKMRAMDKATAERFLEAAATDRLHALWRVAFTCGMRPEEYCGMLWSDVDLDGARIHVQRALIQRGIKGGFRLEEPKTARSRRTIPLDPATVTALRAWKAQQGRDRLQLGAEWQDHGFVFTSTFGAPLNMGHLSQRLFRVVMEKAGIGEVRTAQSGRRIKRPVRRFYPTHRLYDLRHTCATLLLAAGVNVKVVSERLGHATIALTLDIYSHVLPDMQQEATAAMETMFG